MDTISEACKFIEYNQDSQNSRIKANFIYEYIMNVNDNIKIFKKYRMNSKYFKYR